MTDEELAPFDLHSVFEGQEKTLKTQLDSGRQAGHPSVQGGGTEDHWIDFLQSHLPGRYAASRAFVVDSRGQRSEQIDIVIHDRHFSPEFWEWGGHRYLPAESVYAVFEVKPELDRENILYAGGKASSVRSLYRTNASFGWAMGVMPPREIFPILAGILASSCSWSPAYGGAFVKALSDVADDGRIDLGCVLTVGAFQIPHDEPPGSVIVSGADTALITFLLSLLHRLQGLGSAPAIDYREYEKWITK